MDDDNKIIFGAEFEGDGVKQGVDELVEKLAEVKEAQLNLQAETRKYRTELKETEKQIEETTEAMKTASAEMKDKLVKNLETLNKNQVILKDNLKKANEELIVVNKGYNHYNKELNEVVKTNTLAKKSVGDLFNANKVAAEGVKKLTGHVKEMAIGFVSGFAGGLVAQVMPAILDAAGKLFNLTNELSEYQKQLAITNDIQSKAAEGYVKQTTHLELIRKKLNDLSIPEKERQKLLTEYNSIADKGNQIDKTQINNLDLINEKITAQISLIKQRALARAAENIIAEKAEVLLKKQFEREEKFPTFGDQALSDLSKSGQSAIDAELKKRGIKGSLPVNEALALFDIPDASLKQISEKDSRLQVLSDNRIKNILGSVKRQKEGIETARKEVGTGIASGLFSLNNEIDKAQEDLDRTIGVAFGFITVEGLTTKSGQKVPKEKTIKEIENVYAQMLAELKAKLAAARDKAFESEPLIFEKFVAQLNKDFQNIDKLVKDKKLTADQGIVLKGFIDRINEIDLKKEIDTFRKKSADAIRAIDEQLDTVGLQVATKTVENIRDSFEKEKAEIEQGFKNTVAAITKAKESLVRKINEDEKTGLISPFQATEKRSLVETLFGQLLGTAEVEKTNRQLDLAFKTFQKQLELAKKPFEKDVLSLSEETTEEIRLQTARFLDGQIGYDKYQKNLTDIIQKESRKRKKIALDEAEEQKRLVEAQLLNTNLTDQQRQALENQLTSLRLQISTLKRDIKTGAATDEDKEGKERLKELLDYVNAVFTLGQAVISFWQQVNQAEEQALNRSIALQQRRVDNAKEIAERGNAEYLELEEKRLDALERKREENARRQIAINNALTLSQATVAAISAIAQAAQSGSALAAIAAVGAVIGAIGAAFAFVNSLQPQSTNFYEGEEFVSPYGQTLGKDTVKANINIGERIVTTKDNKDYWDSLTAIHNHLVPPEVLNNFVNNYQEGAVPVVDFNRLSAATNGNLGADSYELLQRLDKLDGTMNSVVDAVLSLELITKLDEDGFETSLSKSSRKKALRKKS